MGHQNRPGGSTLEDATWSSQRPVTSRTDIFPKLVSLQRSLNARGFAAFRVAGASLPHKRRLDAEYENWSSGLSSGRDAFVAAYGDTLLGHIEASTLPLMWCADDESSFIEASDFTPFTTQVDARLLPYSGIAFPVRLGAVGNGYIVFPTAGGADLPGELVLSVHSRCYQVMTDILSLDERKAMTSETLSEREIACLQLAGDGRISEEIAERLGLSVQTVNAYLGSATIKLDSVNRIQAIAKAIRLGYIT